MTSTKDELHVARVRPETGTADKTVVFLHGILGTGQNFRSFARRVVDAVPGWEALLVDLRMHGASQPMDPPHTVRRCAEDVVRVLGGGPPVAAVLGHSFGGKVALSVVEALEGDLDRCVVVDAMPGPRLGGRGSETTVQVVELLRTLPRTFPSRAAFLERITGAGIARPIAEWLAMNLVRTGDELLLRVDAEAIGALLEDYFTIDSWGVIEHPPGRVIFDVVVGGRSAVFDEMALARLRRAESPRVRAHVLPTAGHWVHVDDPDGLFRVVESALRSPA